MAVTRCPNAMITPSSARRGSCPRRYWVKRYSVALNALESYCGDLVNYSVSVIGLSLSVSHCLLRIGFARTPDLSWRYWWMDLLHRAWLSWLVVWGVGGSEPSGSGCADCRFWDQCWPQLIAFCQSRVHLDLLNGHCHHRLWHAISLGTRPVPQ